MSLVYIQSTGELRGLPGGTALGYSGLGDDRNNPLAEQNHGTGPIPQGEYAIGSPEAWHAELGPYVMALTPLPGTDTFGRSGFYLHGVSALHPSSSSHGCPCFSPQSVREAIWASGFRTLLVVATPEDVPGDEDAAA